MAATIRDMMGNLFATERENAVSREEFHGTQQAVVNLINQMGAIEQRLGAIDGKLVSHYGARLAACEGDITRIGDTLSDHLHANEPTDKPAEADSDEYATAHKAIVAALSAFHCEMDWLLVSSKYNWAFDRLRQAIFSALEPLDPMRVPF